MAETPNDREVGDANIATSAEYSLAPSTEQMPLPSFLMQQHGGIYVDLRSPDLPLYFFSFIERIFNSGLYFVELDYAHLQSLLYEWRQEKITQMVRDFDKFGKPSIVRLATDVAPFLLERRQYYRKPRLIDRGDAAEYLFEPVLIERMVDETTDAEPDVKLDAPTRQNAVTERVELNVDEFIASMWSNGIRYGINVSVVKKMLAGNAGERAEFARMRPATLGQDATVAELVNSLHRDNAPKVLADGRVDLRQFQNRFPQIGKETRLLKKVPRVLGISGWNIAGHEIVPDIPLDFDIATLAGPGTRVERTGEGEFIVADIGGFLRIDDRSHFLSISEKIVNLEGVGPRTTGNLALSGEEYEEHGIVQERAQIEGKHMTFMADVFGDIVSHGGRVVFKKGLIAGSVRAPGGVITVEGNASRASLDAIGGEITLHYAESCRIVGAKVHIGKAVHCDILAQDLIVETSEGCALAAQKMQVGIAAARHDVETAISMLVPDMEGFAKQLGELTDRQAEYAQAVESRRTEIETITNRQEIKTYMLLNAKLRAKELNMTVAQAANWQKLLGRVTPSLQRLKTLNEELREANKANEHALKKIQEITSEYAKVSTDISCSVAEITGETMIRTLKFHPQHAVLETLSPRELHARLRKSEPDSTILFNDSEGAFEWTLSATDESEGVE